MTLEDQEARDVAVAARRSAVWIEAGAGTGKTRTMVERIVHLVVDPPRTPLRRIAAITFTEKAAAELKAKIREAMQERLRKSPGEQSARDALAEMDIASISTIHSFCQSMLKRRPLQAAIDPMAGVLDQDSEDELRAEFYDQWFDELLAAPPPALLAILKHGDLCARRNNSDWLWRVCTAVCRHSDLLLDAPAQRKFDRVGDWQAISAQADQLRAHIAADCLNPDDLAAARATEFLEALGKFDPAQAGDEADTALFAIPRPDKRGGVKKNWTSDSLESFKAARDTLWESVENYRRVYRSALVWDVFELAQKFAARFAERKNRLGVLGFQDLLVGAERMLRENVDEVRRDLAAAYDEILIDEFQDTDPLQVEIASRLAGLVEPAVDGEGVAGPRLFVVGDPKQSIYRFRRADIEIYEQAKNRWIPNDDPLFLTVNFRCAPAIIDAVNHLFSGVLPHDAPTAENPRYVPLVAGRGAGQGNAVPDGAGVVVLRSTRELKKSDDPKGLSYAAIARWIATAVADARPICDPGKGNIRPMRYGDIAILNRRGTTFERMEEELRALNIPFLVVGGKAYYRRPEITGAVAGLRALADPFDALSLAEWLTSDFVGFSDEDLLLHRFSLPDGRIEYLRPPDGPDEIAAHLRGLRDISAKRNEVGCLATVRALFDMVDAIPSVAMFRRGDVAIANLQKILDLAGAADGVFSTFEEFVRGLAENLESDREEPDHAVVEDGDDVVSLMTIHKAKGLDWPVVILPDLDAKFMAGHADTAIFRRSTRDVGIRMAKGFETEDFEDLREHEKAFDAAEHTRLLYVAMTRARDCLVLPLFARVEYHSKVGTPRAQDGFLKTFVASGVMDDALRLTDDFSRHVAQTVEYDVDAADFRPASLPSSMGSEELVDDPDVKEWLRSALEKRALVAATVTSSPGAGFVSPSEHGDSEAPEGGTSVASKDAAMRAGAAFHLLMERLDWTREETWNDACESAAKENDLDEKGARGLRSWLDRFVKFPAFHVLRDATRYVEVPFTWNGSVNGEPLADYAGRLDLLGVCASGQVVIVDYKTDSVDTDRVSERLEFYRRQGEIYKAATSALFPGASSVVMRFCFVDPGVEIEI